MNIYLLRQSRVKGHDYFDSVVVAAESPEDAQTILKESEFPVFSDDTWDMKGKTVTCDLIGTAVPEQRRGVILASFK
jgi:hypothetical protein